MKLRWLLLPAALLAVLACSNIDPVPTCTVESGPFEARIPGFGELRAETTTKVAVPVTLQWRQRLAWLAEEGEPVSEGQRLALLDGDQLERRRRTTRDAIRRLEYRLRERERAIEQERREVQARLELLEHEKADAERYAPRDEMLFSRHEILDARSDLELLETQIRHVAAQLDRITQRAETELEILRLERRTEEVKLAQIRQALDSLEIRAPHDGVFYPEKDWRGEKTRVGSVLWPGQTIGELPELSRMEAKIQILESEAAGLDEGLEVTLSLDAHPERRFAGTVTAVQPVARTLTWRSPVKYFEITVGLDETDMEVMKLSSQVRAAIFVTKEESVLSVPNQTIFNDADGAWVYVRNGNGFVRQAVSLGAQNLARTVVTEGLEDGDRVALVPPDRAEGESG